MKVDVAFEESLCQSNGGGTICIVTRTLCHNLDKCENHLHPIFETPGCVSPSTASATRALRRP